MIKKIIRLLYSHSIRQLSCYTNHCFYKPSTFVVNITDRCNSRCRSCFIWELKPAGGELNCSEWKRVIKKIKNWIGYEFNINFSGGEPLLRDDICEIVRFCGGEGIKTGITTNGISLNEKIIQNLIQAGLGNISISMNGINPETHDASRGIRGNFKNIVNSINYIKSLKSGITINIGTIILGTNLQEIPDLIAWVKENGLDGIYLQPYNFYTGLKDYKKGWYKHDNLWPSDKKAVTDLIGRIKQLKREGCPVQNDGLQLDMFLKYYMEPEKTLNFPCGAIYNFAVDPYGNVRLCFIMEPIGNILRSDPKRVFCSKEAMERRRQIKRCGLPCRIKVCNFMGDIRQEIRDILTRRRNE